MSYSVEGLHNILKRNKGAHIVERVKLKFHFSEKIFKGVFKTKKRVCNSYYAVEVNPSATRVTLLRFALGSKASP